MTTYKDDELAAVAEVSSIASIFELQRQMLKLPQIDVASAFAQAGGVAIKAVLFRAGTKVVGGLHRYEHISIMTKGDITVFTDDGPVRHTVTDAPLCVISKAGTKRAAIVHADTYWLSLHPSSAASAEELEAEVIVADEEAFLKMIGQ